METAEYIWFDGETIPWKEATVHVMTHGLHYGSSVFEGIRAYDTPKGPAIFRLRDHIERLFNSAKIHRLGLAHTLEELEDACRALLSINALKSAYIRPIAFRGVGDLSLAGSRGPIHVAIAAFPWGTYLGDEALAQGVDTCISSWTRAGSNSFPALAKAGGNYLASQLVGAEAARHGYAEGIALDANGFVSEGSGENIFAVRKGQLITPPLSSAILSGITRDTVIELAKARGIEVKEERMPREALYIADEVFFTGTAAEISPVRSVDQIPVGDGRRGPITETLQNDFFGLFRGTTIDAWGWLDYTDAPALAVAQA